MARFSREKGKRGERELANELSELLGITLKRKVRNLEGESDVEGLEGFSVEVKNCATLCLPDWWRQTVQAAAATNEAPVLFYKKSRCGFRAVISIDTLHGRPASSDLAYTLETSLKGFTLIYRENFL